MRDDVGTNEFLVRSGRRAILSTDTRACRLANFANVLDDDVIEHYLPTALGGEAAPRDIVRTRAKLHEPAHNRLAVQSRLLTQ
jgi:hypothetical protein